MRKSDDTISRQAAIDALDGEIEITGRTNAEAVKGYVRLVRDRLERLPSAEPEDGSDCPFHKRWGIECDDGYSVCAIVQRLKGEEDFNG